MREAQTPSKRSGSIRTRLLAIMLGLVLVPALLIIGISVVGGLRSAQRQVAAQMESVATLKRAEIDAWLQSLDLDLGSEQIREPLAERVKILQEMPADSPEYQEAYSAQLRRFAATISLRKNYDELFVMNPDGEVILSTDPKQVNKVYAERDYFKSGLRETHFTPPFFELSLGQYSIVISQPVLNPAGKVVGVLAGRVSLATLDAIMTERAGLGETGETYLVGTNYALLTGARFADQAEGSTFYVRTDGTTTAVSARTDGAGLYNRYDGEPVVGVYHWLPELEIVLVAEQSQREAFSAAYTTFGLSAGFALLAIIFSFIVAQVFTSSISTPLTRLAQAAQRITTGKLDQEVQVFRNDELGTLAQAFNSMAAQLRSLIGTLEQQVAVRTRSLETSADVSRQLSTILDPSELVGSVVSEIQRAFGYYHVQIYLWDEAQENLLLAGGTGRAGQSMLKSRHLVPRGTGLVGRAAASNTAVLVSDTTADPGWLPNPLLPETKAEAAVPVTVAGKVLGVLDVQVNTLGELDSDAVTLLQSLANQVGVAIQNARQHATTQAALQEATLFRRFVEGAGQGMAVGGQDGKAIYINPALQHMLGLDDPSELVGKRFNDFYPETIQEKMRFEIMPDVMQAGQWSGELVMRTRDSREFPTLNNIFAIHSPDGETQFIAVMVNDMTDHVKTQEALKKQAVELERVTQIGATVGAILEPAELLQQVTDLTQSQFNLYFVDIYLLNPARDQLDYAAGSGDKGRRLLQRGFQIDLQHPGSLVAQTARSRQGVIVNDVRSIPNFFTHDLIPDTLSEMCIPLLVGDELVGVLDVQSTQVHRFGETDISIMTTLATQTVVALQNANQYQQTRQSEQLVRTIIDATPDWIYIKDRQHRYRMVNRAYAEALHRSTEEMLGQDDLELGQPEDLVRGNPDKGLRGFWTDDAEVATSRQTLVIPSEPVMIDGQMRFFNSVKVPLEDENGQIWGVLGFTRDITERERLRQETEDRLAEVNSLYRAMSREAWQDFLQTQTRQTAFFFDQNSVSPAETRWLELTQQAMQGNQLVVAGPQAASDSSASQVTVSPMSLRGDVLGALAVEVDPQHPLTEDELALLAEMSDQVALALESARLFQQTQQALGMTETLYQGSEQVVRSTHLNDVLRSVAENSTLRNYEHGTLMLFNRPWIGDDTPETGIVVANWEPNGDTPASPAGFTVDLKTNPLQFAMSAHRPTLVHDLASDERVDPFSRPILAMLGNSLAFFPVIASNQWIGWVGVYGSKPVPMTEEDVRQVQSLVGQAAAVVQSLRLLEETQGRARYEATLRQVTARVRASTDPDTVLRTAVREVGAMLGRNVVIRLGTPQAQREQAPAEPQPGNGGHSNGGHRTEVDR